MAFLSKKKPNASQNPSGRAAFGAYLCDIETIQQFQSIAAEFDFDPAQVKAGGIAAAVRTLSGGLSPEILCIDLSDSQDIENDMAALADICAPDSLVIAVGTANDVDLYRGLLQAGVQDYLVKPFTVHQIAFILNQIKDTQANQKQARAQEEKGTGTSSAVIGLAGGVGASSFAANLAYGLSTRGLDSLLLDLDIHYGTSALMFDIEPGQGLIEALETPARLDSLFLERAALKTRPNLSILAAEAPLTNQPPLEASLEICPILRENYRHLILDIPRHSLVVIPDILDQMDHIFLVGDLSLRSTREAIRLSGLIEKRAAHAHLHLVLIQKDPQAESLKAVDLARTCERPLTALLPYEPQVFRAAAEKSKILLETSPKSKSAQAIMALLDKLYADSNSSPAAAAWHESFKNLFQRRHKGA